MINVLLYCEGNYDRGQETFTDGEYIFPDGVVQTLIKKVTCYDDMIFVILKRDDLRNISVRKGFWGKDVITSRRLAILTREKRCTHLVWHRDEDNKGLENKYEEVHKYFINAKKNGVKCLAIVPQHMTESWLLSDENAFEQLFGEKPTVPPLPPKPEETWGNKGTDNHPKKYLERVLKQFRATSSSEIFADIAGHSDIDIMRKRCSESFDKKFYTDMQSFIAEETTL
jgi:hypothetical protein